MIELKNIVDNKDCNTYPTTMTDLLRLYLLVRHGGVYIDTSILLQGEVDWVTNVARLPSHFIWNKFKPLPKVLMSFSFYEPNPIFWSVNDQRKTKSEW